MIMPRYHPLLDCETDGTEMVPLFFSADKNAVSNHHPMYLEEAIPGYYRLCSVKGIHAKRDKTYTIHCPACGKAMKPVTNSSLSEEYSSEHDDLYLTTEYYQDRANNYHRAYRLHANTPHNIEMALAYDVKCPNCKRNVLKQVGRCRDYHTLGLYECPVCDRK